MDLPKGARGGAPDGDRSRRLAVAVLLVGFAGLALGVVATLSRAEQRRTGSNDVPAGTPLARAGGRAQICQGFERLPAGTGALRVSIGLAAGAPPRAEVAFLGAGGEALARGDGSGARWERHWLTVPLDGGAAREDDGQVCVVLRGGSAATRLQLLGTPVEAPEAAAQRDGRPLPGRLRVDYLEDGERSWWSLAGTVADRVGRGGALSGRAAALLAVLLTLTSIALAAWRLARTAE